MSEIYENRQYIELVNHNEQEQQIQQQQSGCCMNCCVCCGKSILICLVIVIAVIIITIIILIILYGPTVYEGYVTFKQAEKVYNDFQSENPDYTKMVQDAMPFFS